jgi:hypothetical protein
MGYQGPSFCVELSCLRAREFMMAAEGWWVVLLFFFVEEEGGNRLSEKKGVGEGTLSCGRGESQFSFLQKNSQLTSAPTSGLDAEDADSIEKNTKVAKAAERKILGDEGEEDFRGICFFV